jgi:hypothetical protein
MGPKNSHPPRFEQMKLEPKKNPLEKKDSSKQKFLEHPQL